jgi:UPF0176 protein
MDPNAGKKKLVNRFNREELEKQLKAEDFKRITLSFYRYVIIEDAHLLRDQLFQEWTRFNCLGRIYLSREGVNAQMNVPEHHWEDFVKLLHSRAEFKDIPFKIAVEDDGSSFLKLAIKVRKRIVADGLADDAYDVTNVGNHLDAEAWNRAMDQGATVVDMRNHYESEIGHFEHSILPHAETFREELPEVLEKLKGKENDTVLLYCTGGIRCEKASAFLKHHGFKNVNQLHGGIIDYARQIKTKELPNKFHGKNFVFDERLGESISAEIISNCHQCGKSCDTHVNCANVACNLLFIQCAACAEKQEKCCSPACKDILQLSAQEQQALREGKQNRKRFHSHRKWGELDSNPKN